jgi:hypothetical protein
MNYLALTFNKTIYTHVSCHGFFPLGHKEFGSLLIADATATANISTLIYTILIPILMTRKQVRKTVSETQFKN